MPTSYRYFLLQANVKKQNTYFLCSKEIRTSGDRKPYWTSQTQRGEQRQGEKICASSGIYDLLAINRFLQQPSCSLFTWKSPNDGEDGTITMSQIDFIGNCSQKNCYKMANTFYGAVTKFSHNLLQRKKLKTKQSTTYDRRNINDQSTY